MSDKKEKQMCEYQWLGDNGLYDCDCPATIVINGKGMCVTHLTLHDRDTSD